MTDAYLPPPPRLLAVENLDQLPDSPSLLQMPPDTIAELVVLSLSGDDDRPTAHVACYVESATEAVHFRMTMLFENFLECFPSWTLLNVPSNLPGAGLGGVPRARVERRAPARRRGLGNGSELAAAWRAGRRPARTTDRFLISAIEFVPDVFAIDYLEAVRRLRLRRFDRKSRALFADLLDAVAKAQNRIAEAG